MSKKTYEHGMWLDENRQVVGLDKPKDYTIRINYEVYQENNGNPRLIGKYPCKCVAEDVVKYLNFTYGIRCFINKKVKEI